MHEIISSRDNPLLVKLRKLSQDGAGYRRMGQAWIEGDHLCAALRARQRPAALAVVSETGWRQAALRELAAWAPKLALVQDLAFHAISALESPSRIGFVIDLPAAQEIDPLAASVVLDRLQDAGNVGSILRSAAAFGCTQVLAMKGTAALWSQKVLRAGMGAHFAAWSPRAWPRSARRCWPPAPTAASCCTGPRCPTLAHGCWATKGRACRQPCCSSAACRSIFRSLGAKSR
jgi:tRNA G18 (ribose-2'-O)-methylase SpoU